MTTKNRLRTVGEAASMFGRSVMWLRHQEAEGNFRYEDGSLIEPIRKITPTGVRGARYYDLDMIEAMADSLKRKYVINKYRHERIVNVVKAFRKVEW